MRTRGLATLQSLATHGLVCWAHADSPRLCVVPPEFAASLREDRRTIEAVLRRARVFAAQIACPGGDPFVRLRDPKWTAEGCPSCGARIGEQDLRCELCTVAADIVLDALSARQPAAES